MTPSSPLDGIRIAAPCGESWDGMKGDGYVRFCTVCQKNVYNLSALTASEAIELIQSREGKLCVSWNRRKDGTVLTADCAVGIKAAARRRLRRLTKVAAALLSFWGINTALKDSGNWLYSSTGDLSGPLQSLKERITAAFGFGASQSCATAGPWMGRVAGEMAPNMMGSSAFLLPPTAVPLPGTATKPEEALDDPESLR